MVMMAAMTRKSGTSALTTGWRERKDGEFADADADAGRADRVVPAAVDLTGRPDDGRGVVVRLLRGRRGAWRDVGPKVDFDIESSPDLTGRNRIGRSGLETKGRGDGRTTSAQHGRTSPNSGSGS
jgi:hypothetical protein